MTIQLTNAQLAAAAEHFAALFESRTEHLSGICGSSCPVRCGDFVEAAELLRDEAKSLSAKPARSPVEVLYDDVVVMTGRSSSKPAPYAFWSRVADAQVTMEGRRLIMAGKAKPAFSNIEILGNNDVLLPPAFTVQPAFSVRSLETKYV